jgi:N-acetylneuraminic acid mutarotase
MQKKSPLKSASVSPRALVILLVCAAACLLVTRTLPAFLRSEAPAKLSQRTLTFAERVAYQHAIEDVYWRHRIWPKERPDSKPSLDAMMSQAELEKKVADYLRKSQALEDYWQRPITAEQLQAEMDRMAKHTKQPEMLRELFDALGNDPFIIAECLARSALADRLLTSWYACDQRIHGELKRRAEAELQAHASVEQMKQLSGKYTEIELVTSGSAHGKENDDLAHRMTVNGREWDQTVQTLIATFGDSTVAAGVPASSVASGGGGSPVKAATMRHVKTGVLSPLQEDETRYYEMAVLGKTNDSLKLVTISWPKEPLHWWLLKTENQLPTAIRVPTDSYALPKITDGSGCIDNTWVANVAPPRRRAGHTAVWTGSEMIVWGGFENVFPNPSFNTGARYNPSTDNWVGTTTTDAPSGRYSHTAVWTGSEMIVWGGSDFSGNFFNTGGRYDPATDSWTGTSTTNPPAARSAHTAIWTGSVMIVWGGYDGANDLSSGGKYNASTDSWTTTSTTNAPSARELHTAVWTGSEMIIWGGQSGGSPLNTGGRYNSDSDNWIATTTTNAPEGRANHTGVWSASEMIIWGGDSSGSPFNTGGRYNPGTNSWTATDTVNAPAGRSYHTAVWTGSEMIVWGGYFFDGNQNYLNTGGRYNPGTNSWIATGMTDAATARSNHTAIWTDTEMVVWGGAGDAGFLSTGGKYNPMTDSWVPTDNTPNPRSRHAAVWTGSEMIVWGGNNLIAGDLNTGGRYSAATDSWIATSTANAPASRELPTAVWTGSEMIVWGGFNFIDADLNTGGRYNPITDTWIATTTTNAPVGRESHTAVWTGSSMIIWGGYDGTNYFNTGGRYSPSTDSWTATSIINAPAGREIHGAVWTDSEMIVWGGLGDAGYLDTGGRYNPATDSWTATNTANAPVGRTVHGATWTGKEMIIWGGSYVFIDTHYLSTGGRYNPDTDSWTATSITDAPEARTTHTAVWTGNEMIVWGGQAGPIGHYFNTGGRYDPSTDSWTATSTNNVPDGRYRHTAVWTGDEMIVWGGILYSNTYTNTGGRYCAEASAPTPTPTPTATPTPCTGRCSPTPRPRPTPAPRP